MPENADNVQINSEEITENSSINEHSEYQENQEVEAGTEIENSEKKAEESSENDQNSEEELALPDPDIGETEVKSKKEMPEWFKKKLEREKSSAERKVAEAEALRIENEKLKAQNIEKTKQQIDPNMPRRDEFGSDEEYFLAIADYRDNARHEATILYQRNEAIKSSEKKYQDNLKNVVETGKQKYKDFEERTDYILYGDGFPSNRGMGEAILESDHKDDILYFLGTHIKEAERIAALNPIKAALEIAKINSRFSAKKKSNITKASPPPTPLNGNKGGATQGNPEKMDPEDFNNWYKNKYG